MFMNHAKQYSNLIQKALNRPRPTGIYTEKHHVLPSSMGGTNDPGNLVWLTVHEHLLAHMLLAHLPGSESQWYSVQAILDSAVNIRHLGRFNHPKLRWKKWVRRKIAYQRAKDTRQRAVVMTSERYLRQLNQLTKKFDHEVRIIDAAYSDNVLAAAFDDLAGTV